MDIPYKLKFITKFKKIEKKKEEDKIRQMLKKFSKYRSHLINTELIQ